MARSRKQRERKLKAKLYESQVRAAELRRHLANQNDVLVEYVQGIAEFGHEVLAGMAGKDLFTISDADHGAFARHVINMALHMGLIEKQLSDARRIQLTHMCKQLMGRSGNETVEGSNEPNKTG